MGLSFPLDVKLGFSTMLGGGFFFICDAGKWELTMSFVDGHFVTN